MQKAQSEVSVKLVGNYNIPEIKKYFPQWPQGACFLYCAKNNSRKESWIKLGDEEKKSFFDEANKQKSIFADIKKLAKKKYSLLKAAEETEGAITSLKEEYLKLRVKSQLQPKNQAKNKGAIAYEKFSAE